MNEAFKKMMGERQRNSDGFTYDYGRFIYYGNSNRDKTRIKRSLRNDKRRVKNDEAKYEKKAEGD